MHKVHCPVPVDGQERNSDKPRYGVDSVGDLPQEVVETPNGASLRKQGDPIFLGDSKLIRQILDNLFSYSAGPKHLSHQAGRPRWVL